MTRPVSWPGAIDTMIGFPTDHRQLYEPMRRILYGGYYPMGLELERIFAELPDVGFHDHVWPEFLHDNAARVLGLPAATPTDG
jgi:hypothetical protein